MSTPLDPIYLRSDDLSAVLGQLDEPERPAILLSASVPYIRKRMEGVTDDEFNAQQALNRFYVNTGQPERIRLAVEAVTETALMSGVRIVFGAHPAISPMMLSAARQLGALADSIVIFQSARYAGQLPESTLKLADWSRGRLVFTPEVIGNSEFESYRRSLFVMRSLMAAWPALKGGIFVGGMEGTEEEGDILGRCTHVRRYALASTGAAALRLLTTHRAQYHGTLVDPSILEQYPCSYKLIARRTFADIGDGAP